MNIDLNSIGFWGELGIKYGGDIDECILEFYRLYQKILRDYFRFPEDRDKCMGILKRKTVQDKDFFLVTYLTHLESKIKAPQLSKIKLNDLKMDDLERYSRLLIRRLNALDSEKRVYWRPQDYTLPFFKKEMNKIWFVVKKGVGKGIKSAKNKRVYQKHNEELIIITKQKNFWKLRTSFNTMKEKRVTKKIFSSKKIIICKEDKLNRILKAIIKKYPISEVAGFFYKNKRKVDYYFSSEKDTINKLAEEELKFLLDNEELLNNICKIKFQIKKKTVGLKIIPHQFNVKHIKLVTTGLTPNKIWELSAILSNELTLEDDIYILDSKDKLIRQKFILNSEKIEEVNLAILDSDIDYLKNSMELISVDYKHSFKKCPNKVCFNFENKEIFDLSEKICSNCDEKLIRLGSSATLRRRLPKINEYIISSFKKSNFEFKGRIEKSFKSKKVKFLKFSFETKEFFVYIHEGDLNLKKLIEFFDERNYPVMIILLKNNIAEKIGISSVNIEKVCFPDLFEEYETKHSVNVHPFVDSLYIKQKSNNLNLLIKSTKILRTFLNSKFRGDILEGKTIQRKGNTFEILTNHILKGLSKSWIELGQIHQNKSVPDGFGYLGFKDKKGTYGIDAKLKLSPAARGLSLSERKKQKEYILDFKKKSYGYGGLKSWLVVIKSSKDYPKFQNSIKKLKKESGFENIILLGLEPLLKICEIYDVSRKEWIINKGLFDEFMYKLLTRKGDITEEKIEKIISPLIPRFKSFSIEF
jgi:hypothetical protein